MPLALEQIKEGDVLLYDAGGFANRIIRWKTWSDYSHVEIYDGHGYALASRNGIGVGKYDVRTDGLKAILRLRVPFDMDAIRSWHKSVDGQPYDFWGLLAFWSARNQGRENWRMFCSEYAARALRAGIGAWYAHDYSAVATGDRTELAIRGLDPFNGYDADGIAPSEFTKSALLRFVVKL